MKLTPKVYSVNDYLDLLNEQLANIEMVIQGEITSVSFRKHAYFSLSDGKNKEQAVLSCALWQFRLQQLPFVLEEGLEVQVFGKTNIYKPSGRLTFVVEHIVPVGEGALQKAFEVLKQKLADKGYFTEDRKRTLSEFPIKIGLLTSATGDALRDLKKHLGNFGFQVFHRDIKVEGIYAIDSIVAGIRWFNEHPNIVEGGLDVLVLTRGGGSLESLQAFNSEEVAQAVFASKIPVLSAVGHERDVSITDLVADVRASTPTDAGRILSEHWREAEQKIDYFSQHLTQAMEKLIKQADQYLNYNWGQITNKFFSKLEYFFTRVDYFSQSIFSNGKKNIFYFKDKLSLLEKQLMANDPQLKLKQGYSLVKNNQGKIIKSVEQILVDQDLTITVADGQFGATVVKGKHDN
ncbi:MAG: exodeoxyribonuclease VII large subunit [Patescibacteria group bacterium]